MRAHGQSLLCMLAIGFAWTSGSALQDSEPVKYHLKLASQPLAEALQEFARQSGIQVIFFSRLTDGLRARALEGQYTAADALAALLADSKLTFRVINAKTVEIRPRADAPKHARSNDPAAAASAAAGDPDPQAQKKTAAKVVQLEEVVVTGMAEGLVATRTETPLRQIPQTVAIISREQIRQQNSTDLADALSNATGITIQRNASISEAFYSRGFAVTSFHVDGGAALRTILDSSVQFLGTPDLSEYDHIEVLRGADALFGGDGNPGATVSMVRKRPRETSDVMLSASAGSWNNYRVEGDVTGPLGGEGKLRGRLDALYANRGYFYDGASFERRRIFAVLEYDLTATSLLTAGGSYQWDKAVPFFGGLPRYVDGADLRLPRHTGLVFDWTRSDARIREMYLQFQQEIGSDWKLRINATQWRGSLGRDSAGFSSYVDPATNALHDPPEAEFTTRPNVNGQLALDATLTGGFEWLGRRAEVAIGGDFTRLKLDVAAAEFFRFGPALRDVYDFDPSLYPDPRLGADPDFSIAARSTSNRSGLFASMRVFLDDAFSIVGGARLSRDHLNAAITVAAGAISATQSVQQGNSHVVNPYAGAIYDLNDQYSVYASYSDIYLGIGNAQREDGSYLPAAKGVDTEVGIKAAWRDGALNGHLVLYRIAQYGWPVFDTSAVRPGALYCCFRTGKNASEGADAELSGVLAPGWLIGAGYTFNSNRAAAGSELSSLTPKHLLKLWTSTQLPGSLQRWTIGGNIHAQSRNFASGTYCPQPAGLFGCATDLLPFQVVQQPYVVVNLRAGFQINPNWQAAVSLNNVFDRTYYETVAVRGNWYGEPRGLMLRIDGRY